MTILTNDGIEIFILPDYARCKCCGENPMDMIECPSHEFDRWGDICKPNECLEYEE